VTQPLGSREAAKQALAVLTMVSSAGPEPEDEDALFDDLRMVLGEDTEHLFEVIAALGSFADGLIRSLDADPLKVVQSYSSRVNDIEEDEDEDN